MIFASINEHDKSICKGFFQVGVMQYGGAAKQMMFSFMLTDSENPIRLCRHCTKAFVASRPSAVFCSPQCKNKHNVYKSRAKNKSEE